MVTISTAGEALMVTFSSDTASLASALVAAACAFFLASSLFKAFARACAKVSSTA